MSEPFPVMGATGKSLYFRNNTKFMPIAADAVSPQAAPNKTEPSGAPCASPASSTVSRIPNSVNIVASQVDICVLSPRIMREKNAAKLERSQERIK